LVGILLGSSYNPKRIGTLGPTTSEKGYAMTQSACDPRLVNSESATGTSALFPRLMRGNSGRFAGCEEPDLPELMNDPVLRRMMASDGVRPDHLLALISDWRMRLEARQPA
jgi:hypothetical protein